MPTVLAGKSTGGVILDVPAEQYHADEFGSDYHPPSLSASIVHLLCTRSPLHAWTAHPRLNPNFERVEKADFDVGVAAHALMLEGRRVVDVVEGFKDWKKKEAQERRAAARAAGLIPLLEHQWEEVQAMVSAIGQQLLSHEARPPLFRDGKPEQTIVWDEDGVVCRARLDWLRDDRRTIDDLKTTSRSAEQDAWSRSLYGIHADIQAAFYLRYFTQDRAPIDPVFRWVVVECQPPYALSVITPGPAVLDLANRKIDHALEVWKRCLKSGEWPAYPTRVATAELPAWEEARWLEREEIPA